MGKHASIQSNPVETTEEESNNRQRIAAQIVQTLRTAGFECDTLLGKDSQCDPS
jgi:hypothetical protein